MPQQGAPGGGQPPFMQNNFPGMPGGFNPSMIPPGQGFPNQPGMPGPEAGAAQQMPMQAQPQMGDASVVAHKLPSSQVSGLLYKNKKQ